MRKVIIIIIIIIIIITSQVSDVSSNISKHN